MIQMQTVTNTYTLLAIQHIEIIYIICIRFHRIGEFLVCDDIINKMTNAMTWI